MRAAGRDCVTAPTIGLAGDSVSTPEGGMDAFVQVERLNLTCGGDVAFHEVDELLFGMNAELGVERFGVPLDGIAR